VTASVHPKCVIDKWSWFDAIGYDPHPGQLLFHNSEAKNRVVTAGWGWGKSCAGAREFEALLLSPGTRIWIVGPDYGEASREFRFFWDDLVVRKQLPFAEKRFNVDQGAMRLRTPDECGGSILEVKTERNPHSLEAEDVDAIIYAEAGQLKKATYERCQGRLRMGGYQVFLFTPEGFNWCYKDLWMRCEDQEDADWWGHRGPSTENPHLDAAWLEEVKRTLTQAMYEAKIEGRFRTSTGFVFPDFDPAIHVADLGGVIGGRDLYAGIDYGYTNPFVCLDIQTNADDQVLVVGEYYKSFVTTQEHAAIIREWKKPYKRMLDDPSGADQHETMRKAGLPVEAVACEVETGNELIQELLKIRPDGKPGMLIDASCVNMIREFTEYRYGPTREDLEAKEKPVKANDHTPEAFKRFVSWYFGVKNMGDVRLASAAGRDRVFARPEGGRRRTITRGI